MRIESGDRGDKAIDCAGSLRRSILGFLAVTATAFAACCAALAATGSVWLAVDMILWTIPVIGAFAIFSLRNMQFFHRPDGREVCCFEAANALTAVRIFLVPPVLVLLNHGYIMQGAILWLIAELTDVADGFVARRFRQETDFGLMIDPVGDIMATISVFTWLFISGRVPSWLFALLVARYVQFCAGLAILSLSGRLPKLHATLAGKAVGVVQGAIIMFLLLRTALGDPGRLTSYDHILFPVLGAAFLSVIVSQTAIGLRAVRDHDAS
jgi:phosphatidylglycerophosphate synthase